MEFSLDSKHSIEQEKQWDFLKDLVAKVSDVGAQDKEEESSVPKKGRSVVKLSPWCLILLMLGADVSLWKYINDLLANLLQTGMQ